MKEEPLKNGTAVYRAVRDTSGIDNGSEALLIGKNGELFLYDIPYGTYVMREIRADDTSFVLEEFEVVIDEHSGSYTQRIPTMIAMTMISETKKSRMWSRSSRRMQKPERKSR